MKKLFKIIAEIEVAKENGRTLPIQTGYRPGFNFIDQKQTSGSIDLLDRADLKPGDKSIVEISFISNELLGDIMDGTGFKFFEGPVEIGSGKVINVIGWVKNPKWE